MNVNYFTRVWQNDRDITPLLAQIDDINVRQDDGENLLHVAIARHNKDAAFELIHPGIDVNAQDHQGNTPLHYAAAWNEAEIAAEILQHKADISLVDKHGNTPLWTAVMNSPGDNRLVELLVWYGVAKLTEIKTNIKDRPWI